MTLNETLLRKLSDWHPSGAGRHVLGASDEQSGWMAAVSADRCDSMGCMVWELTLTRKTTAPATATLKGWAERAVKRVNCLMEPLKVVEVDQDRDEAVLRSQAPAQRGEHVLYYEVLLRGNSAATIRRYQASHVPGKHRQQVAFALTHEALAKLAADLAADN
jgi:hypothetical protein